MNVTFCTLNYFAPNDMLCLHSLQSDDMYQITQRIVLHYHVGFVTSYCMKTLVGHGRAECDSLLFQCIAVMA
jgi:hypothetical protein